MKPEAYTSTHTVYRLYDKHDRPLYIGCTSRLDMRLASHRKKPWGTEIARVELRTYPDRPSAREAETAAIKMECPRHNQVGIDRCRLGEATARKVVKVRNCTVLVGTSGDRDLPALKFIPHGDKDWDEELAFKRGMRALEVEMRKMGVALASQGES